MKNLVQELKSANWFCGFNLSNSKEFLEVPFLRGKVFGLQDKQVQVLPAMQMFSPPSAPKRQV